MSELFQTFLYQPFFNLLVGTYWVLNLGGGQMVSMGVTVIVFTIIIRILLLPISLAAHRSEKERRQIAREVAEVNAKYKHDPVARKQAFKEVFRGNRRVVVAEMISLTIQVGISLILWMIFSNGLSGRDVGLLYPFMPQVFPIPADQMTFMGLSLNEPHWQLNLVQSLAIFILETLSAYVSPYPVSRQEVVRLQVTLPVISFVIFAFLPAGKKLFVITTIVFSIFLTLGLAIRKKAHEIAERLRLRDAEKAAGEEKVLVDVKA